MRILYLIFVIITVLLLSCVTFNGVQGRTSGRRSSSHHGGTSSYSRSSSYYNYYYSAIQQRPLTRGIYTAGNNTATVHYGNWGDHCNLFPGYFGINWTERYIVYGKIPMEMIDTTDISSYAITDSCYLILQGPRWSWLDFTLVSDTNCTLWPSSCSIQISEYTLATQQPSPLIFISARTNVGDCPVYMETNYNSLAIFVKSCNENPDFNFKLTIQVHHGTAGTVTSHQPIFARLFSLLIVLLSVNRII